MTKLHEKFTFPNGATIQNRLVMAPMTTYSGHDQGEVSEAECAYYSVRARDVGMVITGTTFTLRNGQGFPNQFYAGCDKHLHGLANLAKTIKADGAKAILQVFHAGRMVRPGLLKESEVVSASDVPAEREGALTPRPLRDEEVDDIIESFVATTKRAIEAGFDGVEVHGANTYLIQQFYSPHSNRRNDRWGGTRDKRMRFPLAVTRAVLATVKRHAPSGFIVGYRMSPEELENPGLTLEDNLALANSLSDLPLDYLHLSLRRFNQTSLRDSADERLIARRFKSTLAGRLPLIGVGSVLTTEDAQSALEVGFDLVALGSVLIADPSAAGKILRGETPHFKVTSAIRAERFIPPNLFEMMLTRPIDQRLSFEH